jgi:hypothetical protein
MISVTTYVFIYADAHHRFTAEEQDWGFTRFVELKKLFTGDQNRTRPIIESDETTISAFVRVLKDPTGVLWHNFLKFVPVSLSKTMGFTHMYLLVTIRRRRRVMWD